MTGRFAATTRVSLFAAAILLAAACTAEESPGGGTGGGATGGTGGSSAGGNDRQPAVPPQGRPARSGAPVAVRGGRLAGPAGAEPARRAARVTPAAAAPRRAPAARRGTPETAAPRAATAGEEAAADPVDQAETPGARRAVAVAGEVPRAGTGGPAGAGGRGGATGGASGAGGSPLPPITDYAAPGPFPTTMQQNTGPGGKYTIVRPQTLGQNGFLHAPITFGPGIGMEVTGLSGLLARFASHGFVIIGTRLDGAPNAAANRTAMLDGLNWIIQQNTTAGSVFEGKLDVTHAISMGYSVGGTAAVEIGNHAAVVTVVSIHGHKATSALHGPMLQTSGTNDTVGLPMQQYTFDNSQVQTFLGTVSGADHGYIQTTVGGVPGGVQTPAIVAWLRYWIYKDAGGQRYFNGNDCVMCTAPWTNPQRKNWP